VSQQQHLQWLERHEWSQRVSEPPYSSVHVVHQSSLGCRLDGEWVASGTEEEHAV